MFNEKDNETSHTVVFTSYLFLIESFSSSHSNAISLPACTHTAQRRMRQELQSGKWLYAKTSVHERGAAVITFSSRSAVRILNALNAACSSIHGYGEKSDEEDGKVDCTDHDG